MRPTIAAAAPASIHADDILCHRRRKREERDAAGDVDEEHPPERGKLPGLERICSRRPRLDLHLCVYAGLAVHRRLEIERRREHDGHIERAHDQEVLSDAEGSRDLLHRRPGKQRRKAEAHDGQSRREAAVVREIADERRDRCHVADADAHAAERAVAEVDERQVVPGNRQIRAEHRQAEKQRR